MLIHFLRLRLHIVSSFFYINIYIFFVSTWKRVYEFLALFYIEYLCRLSLSIICPVLFFSFFLQFNYLMSFILLLLYYIFRIEYNNYLTHFGFKKSGQRIFDGRTMSFEFVVVVWCIVVPIWNNILVLLLLIVFQFYSTFSILFSSF